MAKLKTFLNSATLLLTLLLTLCLCSGAWGATYYVSQAGAGDGSALATPDSVADFNGGAFGALDGDTVYFLGAITSEIIIPDGGADANNIVTIRGDYTGQECTVDRGGGAVEGISIDGIDYVTVTGFSVTNCRYNVKIEANSDNVIVSDIVSTVTAGTSAADCWIAGPATYITLDSWTVTQGEDYVFVTWGGDGTECTNIAISNCTIQGQAGKTSTVGFYIYYTNGITFSNNTIGNVAGLTLNGSNTSKYFYLRNCTGTAAFSGNTVGSAAVTNEGVCFWPHTATTLTLDLDNNTITGFTGAFYYPNAGTDSIATFNSTGDTFANSDNGIGLGIIASTAVDIDDLTISDTTSHAVTIAGAATSAIDDSTIFDAGNHAVYYTGTDALTCTNVIARSCDGDGFNLNSAGTLNCVRCKAYDNGSAAGADSGDGFTAHSTGTINLSSCLGYGNFKSGAAMTESSTGTIYNCTFYNNYEASQAGNFGIWINSGAGAGWTIKNNICDQNEHDIYISNTAVTATITIDSDYNDFVGGRAGDNFYWNGTANATLAAYILDAADDSYTIEANSLSVDPKLWNATTNDFRVKNRAVAIGGTNVGLTTDFNGQKVPFGGGYPIGAYRIVGKPWMFIDGIIQ